MAYLTVQDIMITLLFHPHLDVRGITRGDLRFCHEEAGADLAVQKRPQPLLLLFL